MERDGKGTVQNGLRVLEITNYSEKKKYNEADFPR